MTTQFPGFPGVSQPAAAAAAPAAGGFPGVGAGGQAVGGGGGWAANVAGAKLGDKSGDYFKSHEDGEHIVDIAQAKINTKGTGFIVEVDVVTSETVRVGTRKSIYMSLLTEPGNADVLRFYHTMLAFMLGANFDPRAPLSQETIAHGVSETQPFGGYRLRCRTNTKPQVRDKSKDFTHHDLEVIGKADEQAPAPAAAPPAAPAPGTFVMPPGAAPAVPPMPPAQAAPAPAPAPAGASPQLPTEPPPGWPPGMAWPGAAQ